MHVQFSPHALQRYSAQAKDDSCKYPGTQNYEPKSHGIAVKDGCLRCTLEPLTVHIPADTTSKYSY